MQTLRPARPASLLLLAAAIAALGACRPAAEDDGQDNAADDPVVNLPSVPLPAQPMTRAELLAAVREAASAAAAGADDSESQRALDGRQFALRIRFGCRGPSSELADELLGWSFQPERRTLRLRAMPTISADDPVAAEIAGERIEAVEGFWVPRPWLLEPVCPATARQPRATAEPQSTAAPEDSAAEAAPADEEIAPSMRWPKVGIAQFFTASDPRTGRRDMRAYEAVKILEEGKAAGQQGYTLVLSGRLQPVPGKRVIECVAKGPDTPPDCIVSADFDRVWIETPGSGEIVAEWGSG
jgi:hypothetical protein